MSGWDKLTSAISGGHSNSDMGQQYMQSLRGPEEDDSSRIGSTIKKHAEAS